MDNRENMNIAMNDDELEKVAGGVIESRQITFYEVTRECDKGHKFEVQLTADQLNNSLKPDAKMHCMPCPTCGMLAWIW